MHAPLQSLQIGPNPAQGHLNLQFARMGKGKLSISLYDLAGRRQSDLYKDRFPAGGQGLRLELPDGLAEGLYFLRLETDSGSLSRPILIDR